MQPSNNNDIPFGGGMSNPLELHDALIAGLEASPRSFDHFNLLYGVLRYYSDWAPPSIAPNAIDIFAPSILRTPLAPLNKRPFEDGYFKRAGFYDDKQHGNWTTPLLRLSLFADRIWLPDPAEILANIANERVRHIAVHATLLRSRDALLAALSGIRPLRPLVDAGVIVLYPALKLYSEGVSEALFGTVRSFTKDELLHAWPTLFVNEGLHFAAALHANYCALEAEELNALRAAATELAHSTRDHEAQLQILRILPTVDIPLFEKADPALLVSLRQDAEAFEDFRQILRKVGDELLRLTKDTVNADIEGIANDILRPQIDKLKEQLNGIAAAKEQITPTAVDFTAGVLTEVSLTGDPYAALTKGAVSALAKMLMRLLLTKRSKARPASRIIYGFMRHERRK
jgi:hypothetical protein